MVRIYEIELSLLASDSLPQNGFRLVRTIDLPNYRNIHGLETTQRMIALSGSGIVEVLKWDANLDPSSSNHGRTIIKTHPEDLEGLVRLRRLRMI
jgi:hypothetical protein